MVKVQSCPAKVDRIASLSSTHPHEVLHINMTGDKPCHPPAGVTAAPKTWAFYRPSSGPQAHRAACGLFQEQGQRHGCGAAGRRLARRGGPAVVLWWPLCRNPSIDRNPERGSWPLLLRSHCHTGAACGGRPQVAAYRPGHVPQPSRVCPSHRITY